MSKLNNPDEVVRAVTAPNYVQAHVWEQALLDAGIECKVVGDYLTASIGGISGTGAEIWVHREDLAHAEEILEQVRAVPEDYPPEEAGPSSEREA